jgi:nucleoid-associated protein YgaU
VTITGTSEPGGRIVVFYGSERLAETRADREGQWQIAVAKILAIGSHGFRAERAHSPPGMTGTALVTIERVEPKPQPPAPAVAVTGQGARVAAQGVNRQPSHEGKRFYVIKRGDTLWAIAERYLGSGVRYTWIFEDNRTNIRDPDLIHPQQELKVPAP